MNVSILNCIELEKLPYTLIQDKVIIQENKLILQKERTQNAVDIYDKISQTNDRLNKRFTLARRY